MDNNKILDLPGVVAVGRGKNEILVTSTKPVELPAEIDGLPVKLEIIEKPPAFEVYQGRHRPLRPGVKIHGGSAGFYIEHEGGVYLITCAHIAQNDADVWRNNQRPDGMIWHQPARSIVREIGKFHDWIHPMHGIDGMALELFPWIGANNALLEGGLKAEKIIDPEVGMRVLQIGWKTGKTEGEITHVGCSTSVQTPKSGIFYRLHNTFRTSARADSGDSGGIFCCAETGNVLGVLAAGMLGGRPQWGQCATDICRMLGFEEYPQLAKRENGVFIELTIGSKKYTVNGEAKEMDVAPFIKNGRTFVPLRFVSEALGAEVDWSPKGGRTKKVYIRR